MSRRDYDHLFKLVLLGDSCVGKSCLLVRFADDEFYENYISTIGVDFRFRSLILNDKKVKLQIWDTAGQERYRTITNAYYRGADGIILVFDMFKRETFLSLPSWLKEVEKHASTDVSILVIANKADRAETETPEVTQDDMDKFTHETGIKIVKASAKVGSNVETCFLDLTQHLIEKTNPSSGGAVQEGASSNSGIGSGKISMRGNYRQQAVEWKKTAQTLCCQ
ncbi:hypothetical protein FGO68_gene17130 [Halteria grandinella]|uniref:Uncharacterized protein n=1 Tax=Halteria grandinella TaxID=5974 RepID=A0A8J8T4Q1_HALGN|nr:hypothetical protein FGO68_gene17130 [Halteria grandinella]